jgi:hypothetical protein
MSLTSAQYVALKSELNTDPRAYGYAGPIAAGADGLLSQMLNHVRDGATAPPAGATGAAISINKGTISSQELVEAVVQSEMPANASQRDWLLMVASGVRVRVDVGSTARSGLLAIFGGATVTRANLTAASSRNGSRAEELFGVNVQLTDLDVAIALRQT